MARILLKSQQITKSNNYILEHCVEKLARINSSDYALGFLVDNHVSPHLINIESQTVVAPEMLFEPIKKQLTKDLTEYFLSKPCTVESRFCHKGYDGVDDELLKNKYIDNLRYIPIGEGNDIYAIVILVNIELSVRSKGLIDVTPFLLATITLLKNQKQRAKVSSAKPIDGMVQSRSQDQSQNILDSMLKNTFHPAFIFNDEFKVLKSNLAAHRLFHSNLERGWSSMEKLINKTLPSIAFRLLSSISKHFFLGHLDKQHWQNVSLVLNDHLPVTVDLHLFDVIYSDEQCFGLMINEKTEIDANQDIYNGGFNIEVHND